MSYRLVISPTASQQLADIFQKHPHPRLLQRLADQLANLAAHPARIRSTRPSIHSRPWILLKFEESEVKLYFQIFYRFVPGQEALEILAIDALSL